MKKNLQITIIAALTALLSVSFLDLSVSGETPQEARNGKRDRAADFPPATKQQGAMKPVLTIAPREISLGPLGPGETVNGMFTLKNLGAGSLDWSASAPEGWTVQAHYKLSGVMEDGAAYLRVALKSLGEVTTEGRVKTKHTRYPLQLSIEADGETMVCRKDFAPGSYRETIKLTSTGGARSIFLAFRVVEAEARSLLGAEPLRVDFGSIASGRQVTKQVRLTNKGREAIKWQTTVSGVRRVETGAPVRTGRYVSFLNEEIKGRDKYIPPSHLKDMLELSGRSSEENGFPSFSGVNSAMKYRFTGTGITLYLWNTPDGGNLAVYLDEQFVHVYTCYADQKEEVEFPVADMLADGPHTLTLLSDGGRVLIEGARIHGHEAGKGNPGWIRVSPGTGVITRETDYVNLTLNTQNLAPGIYGDEVNFSSDRGNAFVEVSVEVVAEQLPKVLDVYRYVKGNDYLYTANPQAEAHSLQLNGYRKQGIAFRLFSPDMPGTKPFYRWYHPQRGDHYYSYDHAGGGKPLQGYVFEGTIGNIATSRLTNTRELYRWFNPATGCHFFTTAQNGEEIGGKGYKFDGITGYVR